MTNEEKFVKEIIEYVFTYPDDNYMTMECLCRKLHKHELIAKVDGHWQPKDNRCEECIFVEGTHWCDGCDKTPKGMKEYDEYYAKADRKTEPSDSEKPNNCEELNAYRECVKSRSFWDNKHCDGCYFDERCPFDEPTDESQKKEIEWVYNKRERLWYPYSNGELLFKTEPQTCDTCKFADKEWYEEPCDRCGYMGKYEPKTEPQTEETEMDEYYKDHDEFYEPQTERESE